CLEQIGTPYEVYTHPETQHVATFLGAANLLDGVIRERCFVSGDIRLDISEEHQFAEGQAVKLVVRPEDVFLRKPENLTQRYQKLADGVVHEVNFVGAFERVGVRLDLPGHEPVIVTRPKTETAAFPLEPGQRVTAGVVRFRILPDAGETPTRSSRAVSACS